MAKTNKPKSFTVDSSCYRKSLQQRSTPRAFLSNVMSPPELSDTKARGEMRKFMSASSVVIFTLLRNSNVVGWSFCKRRVSSAASYTKVEI